MFPINPTNLNDLVIALCVLVSVAITRQLPVLFAWLRKRKQKKHWMEYKQQRRKMIKM